MIFDFSIDRGGTFTDLYCEVTKDQTKCVEVMKLLSVDLNNYSDAPTEGIRRILSKYCQKEIPRDVKIPTHQIRSIRMGTTVATNALLERKGDSVCLLISKGLKNALEIGNQSRPSIFDLEIKKPDTLYEHVIEVEERVRPVHAHESLADVLVGSNGQKYIVDEVLNTQLIRSQLTQLKANGKITSIAIVLMHSYAFEEHELKVAQIAREVGFDQVSVSCQIMKRVKFVKRGQTCCVDAYLNPHIYRYLQGFQRGFDHDLPNVKVFFMQSDGGLSPLDQFTGSKAILSGPAGGVVGYSKTSTQSQKGQSMPVIGFDMGGTSTDVSRFHQNFEHIFETEIAGISIQAPQLNIQTVAAGGGSRLFFSNGLFKVGPESVGADPGPVCYRKPGGQLAITDANLLLGRLLSEHFPCIFGPTEDQPLDFESTKKAFEDLTAEINLYNKTVGSRQISIYDCAMGFIRVANETMSRPIRSLTSGRGFNPKNHILDIFGGAGAQHACSIAQGLGISKIYIHKYCGILSAYGLGLADVVKENEEPLIANLDEQSVEVVKQRFESLKNENQLNLQSQGFTAGQIEHQMFVNLRYQGTDTSIMVLQKTQDFTWQQYASGFRQIHETEFGFNFHERPILIDNVRVRSVGVQQTVSQIEIETTCLGEQAEPLSLEQVYFEVDGTTKQLQTKVFDFGRLKAGMEISGPAIILNKTSTILIEPTYKATIDTFGNVEVNLESVEGQRDFRKFTKESEVPLDPIELSIFGHRFMSIAEQMGITLQKTSASTNIKERLDFSCALFDPEGNLVANAPHLPVHLGSMQEAVRFQVQTLGTNWKEGDVILTNHPLAGGTHLPDMTIITPVYQNGAPVFYVASRGHHADIGGIQPGSMPSFSKCLEEEGAAFMGFKIVNNGVFQEDELTKLLKEQPNDANPLITGTRNLRDNLSDFRAQIAANNCGISLVKSLIKEYSLIYVQAYMRFIQMNAEQSVREMLRKLSLRQGLPEVGSVTATDLMDDGSLIRLQLTIDRRDGSATFDFEGTDPEMYGNCNAPRSIASSAVIYCLRCLVNDEIPLNQGCLNPITIKIPNNTFLNPGPHAAVVGGNVLTSQRITDVVLKAFSACAASQGCMNNLTFGNQHFGYYETIAGGSGAGPTWHGKSGVHTHMTNTRITDPEVMELRYPVCVRKFEIRQGSGGEGKFKGGDGLTREIQFMTQMHIGVLSERRVIAPWGLAGGMDGERGKNLIVYPDGHTQNFGAKNSAVVPAGSKIVIMTPGAGGYGKV